ncbi:hypothetical protein HYV86_07215 [Candidatus Woesearchaeota archaeon]|nr:hypothetical protein [Candidatus Woesearchaeota archaeon]
MINELIELGLTKNEAKIYLILIRSNDLSASEVTSKTGIHRRNVYDAIDRLLEKGLITQTEINKTKRFNAVDPKHLRDMVKAQQIHVENIVPQLSAQFAQVERNNCVRLYKGIAGVRASFTDSLNMIGKGEDYWAAGCIDMPKLAGGPFMEQFHAQKISKQIKNRLIFNHEAQNRALTFLGRKNYAVRVLPQGHVLPVQTAVYGKEIVCQILIHQEPFVIQTIDKDFATNFRRYFEILWEISTPIERLKKQKEK